ncbi:hypothetical protein HQO38_24980 [Rhodococcus fascians]|jgi:uncharacterized membrane protein YfcA|uniref:DUF2631 domain-containing protein n=2 Tax=root TaxID=1 RepID=A0A143QN02_RHOFA|nr:MULTISPECIES: hypothetical protein [Rhodococcus]MBJ7350728.1 hypothetical protein [Rhodococcus sp. (in: high G+C Gram-positive bacteria)]MDP9637205.1 putative membrane protein YfcA [Rhodococcus cercidiphylli]MSX08376.1 hypothetical protein [Actinomycetota bacterium]OZD43329.1 hypothetical protein CH252_25035 [Rhodococcus sp. 06-1477-1B]AMY24523.1 hypothetical protein A3Q41_03232 [Rhodococcus fascians]
MSDNGIHTEYGHGDSSSDTAAQSSSRQGPSAPLFLAGLAALIVAIAALIGQDAVTALAEVQFRWVFVIAAVVVGAALLLGPSRKH